jgi:hypothetical protein
MPVSSDLPDVNSQFLCGRSPRQEEVPARRYFQGFKVGRSINYNYFPLFASPKFNNPIDIDIRHRPSTECSYRVASHFRIIPFDRPI